MQVSSPLDRRLLTAAPRSCCSRSQQPASLLPSSSYPAFRAEHSCRPTRPVGDCTKLNAAPVRAEGGQRTESEPVIEQYMCVCECG